MVPLMSRVLLITDDPALPRLVLSVVRSGGHEMLTPLSGVNAMAHWADHKPDLLVVDSMAGGNNGVAFVEDFRRAENSSTRVPVLVVGQSADVEAKIGAYRAGADDYLSKPLNPAELMGRVSGLLARLQPTDHANQTPGGRVIAWYGAKGGVGTTTLAINSAIAMHREMEPSVVLVDAALQLGDHRVFLDLGSDKHSIVDACDGPVIDAENLASCLVRHQSGIDLLLAPLRPESADRVSLEYHHMQQIVETLRTTHDLVVVDLDKKLDDHTLDVIGLCDALVMVLTADLACLKNMRLLLGTLEQVGVRQEKVQLVLNRSNAHTGIGVEAVERVLPQRIAYQVVNDYRTAISSLNSGTPFMVNRPESPIAKGVVKLARGLIEPHVEQVEAPARVGKFAGALSALR
jgi:pilus assembly protein CpaE